VCALLGFTQIHGQSLLCTTTMVCDIYCVVLTSHVQMCIILDSRGGRIGNGTSDPMHSIEVPLQVDVETKVKSVWCIKQLNSVSFSL